MEGLRQDRLNTLSPEPRAGSLAKALEERSLATPLLALGFPRLQGGFQTCLLQYPQMSSQEHRQNHQRGTASVSTPWRPAQHLAHDHPSLCPPLSCPVVYMETEAQLQVPDQVYKAHHVAASWPPTALLSQLCPMCSSHSEQPGAPHPR